MEEEFGNMDLSQNRAQSNLPFKVVRAGKRTYFFDVKTTQHNDFYLTITESKKRYDRDGKFVYEKHKIFLYDEDFESFADSMTEMMNYIRSQQIANLSGKQQFYDENLEADSQSLTKDEALAGMVIENEPSF